MIQFHLDGVVPIIPTPFAQDGSIDYSSMKNLLDFAVSADVSAVCLPAYASEFYKLTDFERRDVTVCAINIMDGRLPVIGQVNHISAAYVAETARELERAGVSVISVAVPRLFNLPERDLLRYFDRILSSIGVPLLIQDFNPAGTTIGAEFIRSLRKQHGHFQYVKLEEPLMSEKVRAIVDATSGEVGVLEGWGGVYVLELMQAGICGIMPGLAVSDVLQVVWNRERQGEHDSAYSAFMGVLPQITYSLQSLEFYHHAEKALLAARGVLPNTVVRDATLTVGESDRAHIKFLNRKVMEWIDQLGLASKPFAGETAAALESIHQAGE